MNITASYYRRGKCVVCGKTVEREKSFSGATLAECDAQAREWRKSRLVHKRCEWK